MKSVFLFCRKKTVPVCLSACLLYIIAGCASGDLKDQILALNERQEKLMEEKDSLMKLLGSKGVALDTLKTGLEKLAREKEAVEARNKTLQSGNYKNSQDLKKSQEENRELNQKLAQLQAGNDSLEKEINLLRDRITTVNTNMEEARKTSETLSQLLKQQEEKRIADSIAEANKPRPVPVKESGYVNITELTGGFGLANTSVDYSRSLIGITNVFGYDITRNLLIGGGTGVNIYNGGVMIPLYGDIRYTFGRGKLLPYVGGDAGLLVTVEDIGSSGLFVNPMVGLNKKLNNKFSLHAGMGLLIQEAPSGMRNSFVNIKGGVDFRPKR